MRKNVVTVLYKKREGNQLNFKVQVEVYVSLGTIEMHTCVLIAKRSVLSFSFFLVHVD